VLVATTIGAFANVRDCSGTGQNPSWRGQIIGFGARRGSPQDESVRLADLEVLVSAITENVAALAVASAAKLIE